MSFDDPYPQGVRAPQESASPRGRVYALPRPPVQQAIILAAGAGSRLRGPVGADPKPLTKVAGISLLERSITSFRAVGVTDFVVVVGHHRERLLPELARLRVRDRIRITPAISVEWELGNGASVLAAEPYARDPFFLSMADHIFDPAALERLLATDDGHRPCAVVVDRAVEHVPDLWEATKVKLDAENVTAIGKDLTTYDAVDTGVFLCRSPLFEALRLAGSEGQHALSDAVRLLTAAGRAHAVDGTGLEWFDVDTIDDFERARAALTMRALRPAAGAGLAIEAEAGLPLADLDAGIGKSA